MLFRLAALKQKAQAVAHLRDAFDLYLNVEHYPEAVFTVNGARDYVRFGRDSTGGAFAVLPDGRILYASSEGEGGVVAADFDAFIRRIVACPYWLEVLRFSGNGDLGQMRRAAAALAAYHADDDDVEEGQAFFATAFAITGPTADPVGSLHGVVSTSDVVVRSPYGVLFMSLLGKLTVDEVRWLRDFAR